MGDSGQADATAEYGKALACGIDHECCEPLGYKEITAFLSIFFRNSINLHISSFLTNES